MTGQNTERLRVVKNKWIDKDEIRPQLAFTEWNEGGKEQIRYTNSERLVIDTFILKPRGGMFYSFVLH